jgi:hypothetical protein
LENFLGSSNLYFFENVRGLAPSSKTEVSLFVLLAIKASWENNLSIIPIDLTYSDCLESVEVA